MNALIVIVINVVACYISFTNNIIMYRKRDVCMYVCMYEWLYVCMDGWMDGWMDG